VERLVERGHDVGVLDNLDPQVHGEGATQPKLIAGLVEAGKVRFQRGDVTDREALTTALDGVETVVHLAAAVGVGQSMYEPYYYVHTNCTGTGLLLELIVPVRKRIKKLVVASSMSLYGEGAYACPACGDDAMPRERSAAQLDAGDWECRCAGCGATLEPRPTPESKTPDIASVYAATKKHQEELCVAFGRAYDIPTFALRFFNVYGPRQSLGNPYTGVAAIFLSRLLNGQPPLVFEDGGQSRDFVNVLDIADAVVRSAEYEGQGAHVLNVCSGTGTSIRAVGEELQRQLGVDAAPKLLERYRAGDIRHCVGDPTKARDVLGFEARLTLAQGLPALIEWCRSQTAPDKVEASLEELTARGLVR
jgi:dTDP-L-rhamnose 4-epimerase